MYFDAETGKISPVKTDKAVALKMAADGYFTATDLREQRELQLFASTLNLVDHNKQATLPGRRSAI